MTHIAVVEPYADEMTRLHLVVRWQAACSCGWRSETHGARKWAEQDGVIHMRQFERSGGSSMKVSWASALVETMCDLKRKDYSFDQAWEMALRLHPVRGVGWREIETENLFESADVGDGPVSFMHRACSDAWHGRKPALRNLRVILDSEGDPSVSEFRWRPQGARGA